RLLLSGTGDGRGSRVDGHDQRAVDVEVGRHAGRHPHGSVAPVHEPRPDERGPDRQRRGAVDGDVDPPVRLPPKADPPAAPGAAPPKADSTEASSGTSTDGAPMVAAISGVNRAPQPPYDSRVWRRGSRPRVERRARTARAMSASARRRMPQAVSWASSPTRSPRAAHARSAAAGSSAISPPR